MYYIYKAKSLQFVKLFLYIMYVHYGLSQLTTFNYL